LLGLGVCLAALYRILPSLNPQVTVAAPVDPACDLRSAPCSSRLADNAVVVFSIEPRAIPVVKPLKLEVQTKGLQATGVSVDFAGVDMNMGFNRPRLQSMGDGRYEGPAMLPVCVRERMTWEARVLLETGTGLLAIPYRFDTYQPGLAPAIGTD